MKRFIIIATVEFLLTFSAIGQTASISNLYYDDGRLIADTSFRISPQQLKKWTAVEDTLTKNILEKLSYPIVAKENNVFGKVIVSFTIDLTGRFNDFYLEKYYNIKSADTGNLFINRFMKSSFYAIGCYSGIFATKGFKSDKDILEKYYLPINFLLNPNNTYRQIKFGWLMLDNIEIKIVH
ncbi:MAG: hypothetical protein WCL06_00970 [Bacteroidota bacterium]